MNGYITVGYEFGAELTYPHAETTTSGLLNAAGELCGVVAVLVAGAVLEVCGSTATNLALTGTWLFMGYLTADHMFYLVSGSSTRSVTQGNTSNKKLIGAEALFVLADKCTQMV